VRDVPPKDDTMEETGGVCAATLRRYAAAVLPSRVWSPRSPLRAPFP